MVKQPEQQGIHPKPRFFDDIMKLAELQTLMKKCPFCPFKKPLVEPEVEFIPEVEEEDSKSVLSCFLGPNSSILIEFSIFLII